ncbi:hypothetical protein IAU59_003229 [Kwoniella sp. CBS 9459]
MPKTTPPQTAPNVVHLYSVNTTVERYTKLHNSSNWNDLSSATSTTGHAKSQSPLDSGREVIRGIRSTQTVSVNPKILTALAEGDQAKSKASKYKHKYNRLMHSLENAGIALPLEEQVAKHHCDAKAKGGATESDRVAAEDELMKESGSWDLTEIQAYIDKMEADEREGVTRACNSPIPDQAELLAKIQSSTKQAPRNRAGRTYSASSSQGPSQDPAYLIDDSHLPSASRPRTANSKQSVAPSQYGSQRHQGTSNASFGSRRRHAQTLRPPPPSPSSPAVDNTGRAGSENGDRYPRWGNPSPVSQRRHLPRNPSHHPPGSHVATAGSSSVDGARSHDATDAKAYAIRTLDDRVSEVQKTIDTCNDDAQRRWLRGFQNDLLKNREDVVRSREPGDRRFKSESVGDRETASMSAVRKGKQRESIGTGIRSAPPSSR